MFTKGERPKGGQGGAALWLPLLALFGGGGTPPSRTDGAQGLRCRFPNELIGAVAIYINEDRKAGRRLKTKQSERFVPVHPQLHSFRHSYIDALRVANVGDEIKHALLGWSGGGIPARYGAKDKAARFRHRLAEAAANVDYTGLDLSNVEYRT